MKKRVLIVDDTLSWVKFNQNLLDSFFPRMFEITAVQSAWEARMAAVDNLEMPFDLVITDLQMDNFGDDTLAGEWLIEQLQALREYYNTKIIIISGMPNIKTIAEKYNVAYISKPRLVSNNTSLKMVLETFFPYLKMISKNTIL
ncbi:response regulator [bacterium]|nr:response regulator [bacterium]